LRENCVRLEFNEAVYWTGYLDPHDASDRERYDVRPVPGTLNGGDPQDVDSVWIEQPKFAGAGGRFIDVWVDRYFSPYPSRYVVSCNQLTTIGGALLDPAHTSMAFDGLLLARIVRDPPRRDLKMPAKDFANPQTREAALDPLPDPNDPLILGTIPVDDLGDYALDDGITNLKKRCLRRIFTTKGAFRHLPDYGIGLLSKVKTLGSPSRRAAIAADIQAQLASEPDVEKVFVRVVVDNDNPSIFRLRLRVKASFSDRPIDLSVPFSPT